MNILNLTDKESEKFKISNYPDGQRQLTITSNFGDKVLIRSRLNNFLDLELIVCAVKSLRYLNATEVHLQVPYFLGSRSDRKFETGDNNYLKDVICPIINSLKLSSIEVLDPHSDVLEACLNNFRKTNSTEFARWALRLINNKDGAKERTIFLSPDGGALKKIYELAKNLDFNGDIINCIKVRDSKGRIVKTEVPHFDITKDVVIFDDICDGGRTFIEIAKAIRQRHESYDREKGYVPIGKIYLVVTHGIFSKGFVEISKLFDGIFTTNSYMDFSDFSEVGWDKTKLKQLNIF